MTLSEEVASLQRAAHDLMYLGMDGSPAVTMKFTAWPQHCIIPVSKVLRLKSRPLSVSLS